MPRLLFVFWLFVVVSPEGSTVIQRLDRAAFQQRPSRKDWDSGAHFIDSRHALLLGNNGRIIHAKTPQALFSQINHGREYLPTIPELMTIRLRAYERLKENVPELGVFESSEFDSNKLYQLLPLVRREMDRRPHTYSVWRCRLTGDSHIVRGPCENSHDTVFVVHGSPFLRGVDLVEAMSGQDISDGGFPYDSVALEVVRKQAGASSRISYDSYLKAKGGNFTGGDFASHPLFSLSSGSPQLMQRYVAVLQVLSFLNFYHCGIHSGWRPGEMRPGYGRPISLGVVGEAFYPPNNSTLGHSALVLQKEPEWYSSF